MVRCRARVAACGAALVLCGCGAEDTAASQAAAAFGAALGAGDLARACDLLAPATRATLEFQQPQPCAQTLQEAELRPGPVAHVEVWGGAAQVHAGSDIWFLTRTAQGWRVAAAGCVPHGADAPYLCKVSGP
jgi:hypothetical protein